VLTIVNEIVNFEFVHIMRNEVCSESTEILELFYTAFVFGTEICCYNITKILHPFLNWEYLQLLGITCARNGNLEVGMLIKSETRIYRQKN
jgi:hypothetical protein